MLTNVVFVSKACTNADNAFSPGSLGVRVRMTYTHACTLIPILEQVDLEYRFVMRQCRRDLLDAIAVELVVFQIDAHQRVVDANRSTLHQHRHAECHRVPRQRLGKGIGQSQRAHLQRSQVRIAGQRIGNGNRVVEIDCIIR
jgi:hypothetical protein